MTDERTRDAGGGAEPRAGGVNICVPTDILRIRDGSSPPPEKRQPDEPAPTPEGSK